MSLRNAFLVLAIAALPALSGCMNDCQRLCNEMAAYWDDCPNITFGESQASDCRQAFREDELIEKYEPACAALIRNAEDGDGNVTTVLRAEYDCDDMQAGPGAISDGE